MNKVKKRKSNYRNTTISVNNNSFLKDKKDVKFI